MGTTMRVKGGWSICCKLAEGRIWLENESGNPMLKGDDGMGNFRGHFGPITLLTENEGAEVLRGLADIIAELNGLRLGARDRPGPGLLRYRFEERPHATVQPRTE